MPEMHWRQPGTTHSTSEPFTKNRERIQKFKGTRDSRYIHQSKLDKASYQHDKAYGNFKYLTIILAKIHETNLNASVKKFNFNFSTFFC